MSRRTTAPRVSGPVDVSVVIPTHNRPELLAKALDGVLDQGLAPDRYEVVVVDNASDDDTRRAVEPRLGDGRVRYVSEPSVGLSHARNTGWRAARGRIVAFLDDDAIPAPDWLERVLEAFEGQAPPPGCVGGRVLPIWEGPRPSWLDDALLPGLTVIDWGPEPHRLLALEREWPVGANMAFRREVLEELGGFVAGLDRSGSRMLSSGDVHMARMVQQAGHDCWYDPRIVVRHHVPRARLTKRWFRHRYYAQGLSDAVMHRLESRRSRWGRVCGAGWRAIRLLGSPRKLVGLLPAGDDPRRFTRHCFSLIEVGHIVGLLRAGEP